MRKLCFFSMLVMMFMLAIFLRERGSSVRVGAQEGPLLRVPQDYLTIQAAIDAAPEGATIQIAPGRYAEDLLITKSLKLKGGGAEQTILQSTAIFAVDNQMILIQAQQDVKLELGQLALHYLVLPGFANGVKVEGQGRVSLVIEQTSWLGLAAAIQAFSLHRLEIRESIFRDNSSLFSSSAPEEEILVEEAAIERNRFFNGGVFSLRGKHLRVAENVIMKVKQDLRLYLSTWQGWAGGFILDLLEGGKGEVIGNFVSHTVVGRGISISQSGRRATWIVRENWLLGLDTQLVAIFGFREDVTQQLDVLIESNTVVGACESVQLDLRSGVEGGAVHLRRNRLWGVLSLPGEPRCLDSPGVSVRSDVTRWPDVPLQLELNDNQIGFNGGWGLALNYKSYQQGCYPFGLDKSLVPPQIVGINNIFVDNSRGDLCPADYPWPPGFRK